MKSSTISSKGQVTIPQDIRIRMGLKEGDRIEFVIDHGQTVIRPARTRDNPLRRYLGAYPAFKNRKEINDWIGEMRDEGPDGR